jgi:hypothetical protein
MTIGEVFALSALLLQLQAAPGDVHGTVMAERDGRRVPLPYAMVEVKGPTGVRWVMADAAGRYLAGGVSADAPLRLRAVHLGHEDARLEVTVPSGSRVTVDLVLTPKPIELPPVLVNAGALSLPDLEGDRSPPAQARARGEVALRALEATPGLVESGVGEAARRLPGNEPSDPTDVLFMRGSTADMKLVLLDGAPVYTPFHMGGLLRSFDAEVLGSATHHVGGAPARYDGGLSYILDLKTRRPSRSGTRWVGGVDLMSARSALEASVGSRAGVLLSTRALHGLQSRLAGGRAAPYGYLDGLAKAEMDLSDSHRLSFLAFGNGESVRLSIPSRGTEEAAFPGGPLGRKPESASWGNALGSFTYAGEWKGTAWELRASTTRYRADLPLPLRSDSTSASAPPAAATDALLASGETRRSLVGVDGVRFFGSSALRFGGSLDASRMRFGALRLTSASQDSAPAYERTARATVAGAYLDLQRPLSSEVHLRAGARWDSYGALGARAGLRLGLLWSMTENALLTMAGGRYHQLVRASDADAQLAMGIGTTTGTGGPTAQVEQLPLLSVGSADHFVLSLDQQLTPALRLTTEGFFKRFSGMDGLGRAQLNASGLDLRVLRVGERVTGWLGYSLSWFWDSPDPLGRAEEFTGRHLLSLGLQGRLARRWGLDFALAYSDGLPLTSIPFARGGADFAQEASAPTALSGSAASPLGARDSGTFLRVDLEGFAELEAEWGSRKVRLRPYLRVLNALDRRDALFYYFEPWRDPELRPLAELSVIPVLGLEWRF